MKIKSLKSFAEILNRSEGVSLIAIIAMLVIMSVMGGVFSSVMGRWKISAPTTINSAKALYLAETAAMFALQDAKYRFFSKDANGIPLFPSATKGTRSAPYIVSNINNETAEFWIERPYPSANTSVDEYPPGTHRGNNDDATTDADDDVVDDDLDDASGPTLYSIIATGKVKRDGTTVAKRQIKIKADITDNSADAIEPGVHTDGVIKGSGSNAGNGFGVSDSDGTNTVVYNSPGDWNYAEPPYTVDDEDGLIFRSAPTLDKGTFKAMAIDQGHYHNTDLTVDLAIDNYPNGSYYYDSPTNNMPNIIYIEGSLSNLKINANRTGFGIYYVEGNVNLAGNDSTISGIVICEGDITLGGTSTITGGIIHYGGVITGNGNPAAITLDSDYFDALNATIPIITIVSSQEAVSAN